MIPVPEIKEPKFKFIRRCFNYVDTFGVEINKAFNISFNQWDLINEQTPDPDLEPTKYNDKSLIERVYSGVVNPLFLPLDLYVFQYLNVMSGVGLGFGLPSDFIEGTSRYKAAVNYKKNIESFSGAKTFNQTLDLSNSVFNADGIKRSFKEFREIALKINNNYNINWLRTEQNAAFRVAQSAENWQIIQDEKDVLPLLQYVTVGDARVRPEHAAWDGIIKPVNDPFWDTRFYPNDWGCRCIVIQLEKGSKTNLHDHLKKYNDSVPIDEKVKSLKNDSKVFANNPGKSGVIFPKTGIAYKVPPEFKKAQKNNFGFETPPDSEVKKTMKKVK